MVTVNLAQAKARLSELPDKVEAGQEVIITRRGKVVARPWRTSLPLSAQETAAPAGAGRVSSDHASVAANRRGAAARGSGRAIVRLALGSNALFRHQFPRSPRAARGDP